ncbi:MAG: hypothetical protein ABIT01_05635 [Thermoanaerobaculia bacterium]
MSMDTQDRSPVALELLHCPSCGYLHPHKPTLTPSEVAFVTSYATASIYTYHSRGGILPRPVRNGRGNPRWSACAIARWLAGTLPPEDIQPVRIAGRAR